MATHPYDALVERLAGARRALLQHPVHQAIPIPELLRCFMRYQAFAVWDAANLLRTLQRRLSCLEVPWRSAGHRSAARLISAVALGEEAEAPADGQLGDAFELYVGAMIEVGAPVEPMARFLSRLRAGGELAQALGEAQASPEAAEFVRAAQPTALYGTRHEVAAAYLFGREDRAPELLRRHLGPLGALREPERFPALRGYLERHPEAEQEERSPHRRQLLVALCGADSALWAAAAVAAEAALSNRLRLWDGVTREAALAPRCAG